MDNKHLIWAGLIAFLAFSSVGLNWFITGVICLLTFIVGFFSLLYVYKGDVELFYRNCSGNPLSENSVSDGGLKQVVNEGLSPKKHQKSDSRVTGSELIDSSLQEILGYIIRDYVSPWYNMISLDDEFSKKAVRQTAQQLAINISNRVKEVDWIPYLTTRLVDDAASHLKLYKQARAKMKEYERIRTPKNSPRRDVRNSPKRVQSYHKRNKSETDISRYYGSRGDNKRETDYTVGHSSKFYLNEKNKSTLEDYFFDLECTMENGLVCRDLICTDTSKETEFLCELIELLLYILLPDQDFQCKPLRFILREIFANCVFVPLISMLSDPDYINQAMIWLCLRDMPLPSDIFLMTIRTTDNVEELKFTKETVSKEIHLLRSRDSGGDSDLTIKQQLSSLLYVIKMIDNRLLKIESSENDYDCTPLEPNSKIIDIPLDFVLSNNVALSYFIDYISGASKQDYLFFYLNIDGWKSSALQQLANLQATKGTPEQQSAIYENMRSTACSIYNQYIDDKAEHHIELNGNIVHKLLFNIKNLSNPPAAWWFDDVQKEIYSIFETQEEFFISFKKSKAYIKLLQELDLYQQEVSILEEDNISLESLGFVNLDERPSSSNSNGSGNGQLPVNLLSVAENMEKCSKHVRSLSDVTTLSIKRDLPVASISDEDKKREEEEAAKLAAAMDEINERNMRSGGFVLSVKIIETGIVCEKGKTFGIYATHVSRQYDTGFLEEWHIYRRYSDFHDLHTKVKEKFPDLGKIAFPGKKTFHNMDRSVLERRMKMLGVYMQEICQPHVIQSHIGLKELLMAFLEQGEYDRATSGGPISNTIDTIVNPIKTGMKTIKNMPEQLIQTVDEVVEKVFQKSSSPLKSQQESSKVGASLDIESDDNIPLRIMLLLVDEVFDLKSRNQWLRRRIVTILRQIVRTMFGDIVNRRILDYVSLITSPKNVAYYLHVFKQSFWPNGVKVENKAEREEGAKYRTRVAAKIALLSCLTDELKHIIGSETTRKGLLTVFDLFQRPVLNKRLIYVLLEGVLSNLFPEKDMQKIFQKLHSQSTRTQPQHNDSTAPTR